MKAVPFFDATAWTPARHVSSLMFFVNGEWQAWLGIGDKLEKMKMTPVQAAYFGDVPERSTDQRFGLLHLTAQRASYDDMYRGARGISSDFQNLSASLAKINLFFEWSKAKENETTRFVQTEIEYIVFVCRSVFDLL